MGHGQKDFIGFNKPKLFGKFHLDWEKRHKRFEKDGVQTNEINPQIDSNDVEKS